MPRSQIKKNKKEVWRQLTHSDITALGYHWTECELIMSRLQRCFNQWTIASVDKSSDGLPRAHSKLPSKRTKAVKPNTSSETTQIVKERKKEVSLSLHLHGDKRSVFSRLGPVPMRTPSADLTTFPSIPSPWTSRKATAASQVWGKHQFGLGKASSFFFFRSLESPLFRGRKQLFASECSVRALSPCGCSSLEGGGGWGGTRGLDRVYIYSWEVSFPLGQCEDMSVRWQTVIRGYECMCVGGVG